MINDDHWSCLYSTNSSQFSLRLMWDLVQGEDPLGHLDTSCKDPHVPGVGGNCQLLRWGCDEVLLEVGKIDHIRGKEKLFLQLCIAVTHPEENFDRRQANVFKLKLVIHLSKSSYFVDLQFRLSGKILILSSDNWKAYLEGFVTASTLFWAL